MTDDRCLMLGLDGQLTMVDFGPMLARHRVAHMKARAAAVSEVADMAACEAFSVAEVEAAATERFGPDITDAAFAVVWELQQAEHRQ